MKRGELEELHYIAPISSLPSICEVGLLSHRRAETVPHLSVAMPEVQALRAKIVVPGGRPLHDYANLYFSARNPMLYKRKGQHATLCVVRVSPAVLDLAGVVVTDGNASSKYVRFSAGSDGLRIVERSLTYATDWTDADRITYWRKASAKCAEVLVPGFVPPHHVMGAWVSGQAGLDTALALGVPVAVEINSHLFFL